MNEKNNDMILNMMANQNFALRDFQSVGLNSDNTMLLSEDKYKESTKITENPLFQNDQGVFDENKFHQFYLTAADWYNKLASENYDKTLLADARFSEDNMWVAPEKRTISNAPKLVKNPNTYLVTNSLTRLGKKGERTLSVSEIAQAQQVYDYETGQWKDSPNDSFWDNFANTLVLATYDEDEYDEQGNLVHAKGDMKLNEDYLPYYETLGGRNVAGKQVLNKMNVLTTDGSFANHFDFFDSDDLDSKTWAGSLVKNAALVGSMFIPYVGPVVAGMSVLSQTIGIMGTLGRLITGSDTKAFNNMEGWAKSVSRQASTEYATKNTWCGENIINMVGDVVGQLAEQRWLFKAIPTLVYGKDAYRAMSNEGYSKLLAEKTAELNKNTVGKKVSELFADLEKQGAKIKTTKEDVNKFMQQLSLINNDKAVKAIDELVSKATRIGSPWSKAYMTAITVQDTYGEAKEAGASDLEALFLTLGYAAGEAMILNSEVGSWILPEARADKFRLKAISEALTKDVRDAYKAMSQTQSKEGFAKKLMNIGKKLAEADYAHLSGTKRASGAVLANALSEGFEEVSEELLADVSKSAFNATRWLRGKEGLDMGQWENLGDRYLMSAFGGFLGGGITSAATDFTTAHHLAKMDKTQALQELLYIVNNGKEKDFLKSIDSMTLGNTSLSATEILGVNEKGETIYGEGTADNNQDAEIKKLVHNQVDLIRKLLDAEGARISTESLIARLTAEDQQSVINNIKLGNLRGATSLGLYLQDFQNIQSEIVATKARILSIENNHPDSGKPTQEEQEELNQLNTKLQGLRIKKDAYIKGTVMGDFVRDAVFEMNPILSDFAVKANLERFAEYKFGRPYKKLTKAEQELAKTEFENYQKTDLKNDIHQQAAHFQDMLENATPVVQQYIDLIKQSRESAKAAYALQATIKNTLEKINQIDLDQDPDTAILQISQILSTIQFAGEGNIAGVLLSQENLNELNEISQRPIEEETPEKRLENLRKRNVEFYDKLHEHLVNNSEKLISSFTKQGFIHPETREVLDKILEMLQIKAEDMSNKAAYDYDMDKSMKYADIKDNFQKTRNEIKELPSTPILEWLSSYQTAATTSTIDIKKHYENTLLKFKNAGKDLDTFGLDTQWENDNLEIETLIASFKAIISGMRTDNADFNNPTSYTKVLNEVYRASKIQNYIPLAEMTAEDADLVLQDLEIMEERLQFAKNLHALNKGQKLKEQSKVGINQTLMLFDQFKNLVIKSEPLKDWKEVEILKNALASVSNVLNEDVVKDRNLNISFEERKKLEKAMLTIQDAINDFFKANMDSSGRIDKKLLKQLASEIMSDAGFFEKSGDPITTESKTIDKNAFFWWFVARGALRASSFNKVQYNTITGEKAPIPSQELGTYLSVAAVVNCNILNDCVDAYKEAAVEMFNSKTEAERIALAKDSIIDEHYATIYLDKFPGSDALPQYKNMVFIEGRPGTGKSGGVFYSTKESLEKINPEVLKGAFYVHVTQDSATSALDSLKLKDGKAHDKASFMKYISSEWKDNSTNIKEWDSRGIHFKKPVLYKDSYEIVDGRVVNKLEFNKYTDAPKVIFLDEVSQYNEQELSLIEQWATYHQCVVLTAGDLDQDSNVSYIEGTNFNVSNSRNKFIRCPKLGISLRSLNTQMVKSLDNIQANISKHRANKDANLKIDVNYYIETEGNHPGLYGTYVRNVDSSGYTDSILQDLDEKIQLMIRTLKDPNDKIGYIYHDTESKLYKLIQEKYSDKVILYKDSEAQGLEGQYYIVENNRNVDKGTYLRSINTGVSRAEQGVLLIGNGSVSHTPDETYQIESFTEQSIKNECARKKELLESILDNTEMDEIEILPPDKLEHLAAPINQPATKFVPPAPAPTNEPTKGTNPSANPSEEEPSEELTPKIKLIGHGCTSRKCVENYLNYVQQELKDKNVYEIQEQEIDGETVYVPMIEETGGLLTPVNTNRFQIPGGIIQGDDFLLSELGEVSCWEWGADDSGIKLLLVKSDGTTERIYAQDFWDQFVAKLKDPDKTPKESACETDFENEVKTYAAQAEGSSLVPRTQPQTSGEFVHELYSAMTLEMGGRNENNKLVFDMPQIVLEKRIDNGVGLSKLLGTDDYEKIKWYLGQIKGLINSQDDNAIIAQRLKQMFGLQGNVKIAYAIKSTAGEIDPKYTKYLRYYQGANEEFEKGQEGEDTIAHRQKLIMILEEDGVPVYEQSVAIFDSPITLIHMRNENGQLLYPDLYNVYKRKLDETKNKFLAIKAVVGAFENNSNYTDIINRCKMWMFRSNGIIYLNDNFNVVKNAHPTAPIIKNSRGKYDEIVQHQFDKSSYTNILDVISSHPELTVSSIMASPDGSINGTPIEGLHRGHAFVLVSNDPSLNSDIAITEHFVKQCFDARNTPNKVSLIYVIPPSEKPSVWVKHQTALRDKEGGNRYLGNDFTAYRIIQALSRKNLLNHDVIPSTSADEETITKLKKIIGDFEAIESKWKATELNFKDQSEADEFNTWKLTLGEEDARVYMMNKEIKQKLNSTITSADETTVAMRPGTRYKDAFRNFILNTYKSKEGVVETSQQTLDLIDSACAEAGLEEIMYESPYSTESVGPFAKIAVSDRNKFLYITAEGAKPVRITAKLDGPQYNTSELNETIAKFVNNTDYDTQRQVWKLKESLRTDEERYLVGRGEVRNEPTDADKIKSQYKTYFESGELDISKVDSNKSNEEILIDLISDYNKKSGNFGFIHNGNLFLGKFENPRWKLSSNLNPDLKSENPIEIDINGTLIKAFFYLDIDASHNISNISFTIEILEDIKKSDVPIIDKNDLTNLRTFIEDLKTKPLGRKERMYLTRLISYNGESENDLLEFLENNWKDLRVNLDKAINNNIGNEYLTPIVNAFNNVGNINIKEQDRVKYGGEIWRVQAFDGENLTLFNELSKETKENIQISDIDKKIKDSCNSHQINLL